MYAKFYIHHLPIYLGISEMKETWIKQKFEYGIFKGSSLLGCDAVSLGKNRIEQNRILIQALLLLMHVGLNDRPFVPLKMVSKSWEPCSFNKIPECPQN
jgi:hypothetical protein